MDIPAINQKDYGDSFCMASCYLAIAQYFGYDVSMQDLIDEKIVASSGWVKKWGDYFTRGAKKSYSTAKIKKAIDNDNPVIIKGKHSGYDHYVVAYDYSGSTIYIMDPWGGEFGSLGDTAIVNWSHYYVCTEI